MTTLSSVRTHFQVSNTIMNVIITVVGTVNLKKTCQAPAAMFKTSKTLYLVQLNLDSGFTEST
jgi:hypothetical protein